MALSGALSSGFIRNPLASPDVLGISKAAGFGSRIVDGRIPSISIILASLRQRYQRGLVICISSLVLCEISQ